MKENERFGKLITIKLLQRGTKKPHTSAVWLCKCDCGNEKIAKSAYLLAGDLCSCGCLRKIDENKYYNELRDKIKTNIIIDEKGCWMWQGAKHRQGYGHLSFRCKAHLAHRVSWMIFKGDIPKGIKVCHKCDITSCVNPEHLFLGTQKDNVTDCVSKGHFKNRRQGRPRIKLKWDQVQEVKKLHSEGIKRKELEIKFNVGQTCIAKILQGKSWNINWTEEL